MKYVHRQIEATALREIPTYLAVHVIPIKTPISSISFQNISTSIQTALLRTTAR
jgi:hypothetical protein